MGFDPHRPGADSAARFWFLSSVFWMLVGPALGLLVSTQFLWPEWWASTLDPLGLTFGELRAVHTNAVIFAVFGTGAVGSMFYAVPRLVDRNLWGEGFGVILGWVWNGTLVLDAVLLTYAEDLLEPAWVAALLARQPFEYAEAPLLVDALVLFVVGSVTYILLRTLADREEPKLYAAVWFMLGGLLMTVVTYAVGNFVPSYVVSGTSAIIVHGWWLHNVVGLFITPIGLGITYYVIPKAARKPLYSHRLSIIGFWALVLVYPPQGIHHYLQAPIPTWLGNVAIVSSMLMLVPVFASVTNFLATPRGAWDRLATSYPLRFAIVGTVFYLVTCIQGPLQAVNTFNWYIHFTEWVPAHAHLAILGGFVYFLTAMIYLALPRVTGRQFWSRRLAQWHFWLLTFGFLVFWLFFTSSGLSMAAGTNAAGATVDQMNGAVEPLRALRSLGGAVMVLAFFLFGYNVYGTAIRDRGEPFREGMEVVPQRGEGR